MSTNWHPELPPRGRNLPERWYEVGYSKVHHGHFDASRPWCVILRSRPGTPGEPSDGVRHMSSYPTRAEAIREVAKNRALMSRRYKTAKAKADKVYEEEVAKFVAVLELVVPQEGPQ